MFHLPHSKVEVIVPFVGGAYGSKSYFKIEPLAVAMARKTGGRPVRVVQSVTESMLTTRRHSARVRIKTGVKRDGTLVAREAEVLMDTGAYADNGPRVAKRAISRMLGPYKLDHCKVDVLALLHEHGARRIDAFHRRAANDLGVGIAHGHDRGAPRHRPAGVSPAQSAAPRRSVEARRDPGRRRLVPGNECGRAVSQLDRRRPERNSGAGVAVGVSDSEAMPVSVALVRLLADGSVILSAGTTEVGQGARTILCQIVAQELSMPVERSRCAARIRWRRHSIAPPARAARRRSWAAP